ncbi:peptidase C39 family protein [Thalassobaculum sp.]|uniref:peptidase C39 family protein n=1 Tax=Thalassobaculum sp. TaxID=2022740 RepID=UPI0032EC5100
MDSAGLPADGRLAPIVASAGGVAVAGVVRSATGLARILEIDGPGAEAAPALAGFVEAAAARGCTVVRAELAIGDPATAALRAAGFHPVDPAVHAAQPARPVRRFERRLDASTPRTLPYYAQSTWFTCGAVALMLAHRRLDPAAPVDRRTEIDLWRQATTVHAPRGPGGCDPFGVACVGARLGLGVRVVSSTEGPFFMGRAYEDSQLELMRFVQAGFRAEAAERGVASEIREWTHADLAATVAAGGSAIVLIDQTMFHGEAIPHWVLVHGTDGDAGYVVDDPWVEPDDGETDTDRYDLPVPAEALDRMAWWGAQPVRATVLVARNAVA